MKRIIYAISLPLFVLVYPLADMILYGENYKKCLIMEISVWLTNLTEDAAYMYGSLVK